MFMQPNLFSAPGSFWRGNLHTHSDRSDGILPPEEVCRRYKAEGYDFISLTDHFVGLFDYPITDTAGFRDADFTTIFGAELHSGAMENGEIWHILAVGLPPDFQKTNAPKFAPVPDQESGPEVAARARAAGAYVAIAHPEWSGMTTDDARSIDSAHSVEVYNHGCAIGCDRPHGFYTLDQLLTEGRRLTLCATDDAHFYEPDHFGGWVMVKATENEPDALVDALKAGDFYSSMGPEFRDVQLTETEITVRSSEISRVIVQGVGAAAVGFHGDGMTEVTMPLARFENSPWIRVTIADAAGNRAWLNPIWKD